MADKYKTSDQLIDFALAPLRRQIEAMDTDAETINQKYAEFEKNKAAGKCVAKYYQYGFVLDFDCPCPECTRYSDAFDIAYDIESSVAARSALLENGFSMSEATKYVDIFIDTGICSGPNLRVIK